MSKMYCPFLYGKFRKFFRIAALAVTLGAAGCAGSSEPSDEVVDVDHSDMSSEDMASNDEGSGLIIEQEAADDTANEYAHTQDADDEMTAPAVESESFVSEDTDASFESSDTDAVPQDIMAAGVEEEETPESIDATLDSSLASSSDMGADSDTSMIDEAISAQPVMDEAEGGLSFDEPASMASTSNFGHSSGVLPPGVTASPGAAIFIQSKYEKPSSYTASSAAVSSGSQTYVVKPGDTVSGIARKLYGSFAKTQALAEMNGITAPYVIHPGDVLKVDVAGAKASKATASGTIKVKAGDTLSKIAGQFLGNPGAWKQIYDLNKSQISNPNIIRVGMTLSLGGASKGVHASRPAGKKPVVAKKATKVQPKVETPVPVAAPVDENDVPVAQTVDEPAMDDEAVESIQVELPMDDEED